MSMSVGAANTATSGRAYGAGVTAALLTLAVAGLVFWLDGRTTATDEIGAGLDLGVGDCINTTDDGQNTPTFRSMLCASPHQAQVGGIVQHPDAGRAYPGDRVTAVWFERECSKALATFLGADVLATTLQAGIITPTADEWDAGSTHAVCYAESGDPRQPLTASLQDEWQAYERGDEVLINRLMAGDCFNPNPDLEAYDLRSSDPVLLVDCDQSFSGLFFGRAKLPFPAGAELPPSEELTDASTTACAGTFERFFEVDSATGYTYRFWRPSRTNWERGSRDVLCSVLSDVPVEGPFVPADYPPFHDLGSGQCFALLPEQLAESVSLDDHVRPIKCSEPHVGQMIGSGELDASSGFPGLAQSSDRTERECRTLFETFVGIQPSESIYGEFPYWFPDEEAWEEGDTRFACAILGDTDLTRSLQGSNR